MQLFNTPWSGAIDNTAIHTRTHTHTHTHCTYTVVCRGRSAPRGVQCLSALTFLCSGWWWPSETQRVQNHVPDNEHSQKVSLVWPNTSFYVDSVNHRGRWYRVRIAVCATVARIRNEYISAFCALCVCVCVCLSDVTEMLLDHTSRS